MGATRRQWIILRCCLKINGNGVVVFQEAFVRSFWSILVVGKERKEKYFGSKKTAAHDDDDSFVVGNLI